VTQKRSKTSAKAAKTTTTTTKATPGGTPPKRVSLKKAVAALQKLLRELEALPAAKAAVEGRTVEGLRKQIEGMVLTMEGACQGRNGGDDFSFPSA
jgi:hypothetical protein